MRTESVILKDYSEIEKVFERLNVQRPFVCCTQSFEKSRAFEYLKRFNLTVFDNVRANPRFEDMVTATKLFNDKKCDFMIGAGGGSPMDSAKMIRLMATNTDCDCINEAMKNNEIKSLFIPTTAGTGSEATKSSVFYVNENEKVSVANYDFIPNYIIFDENLLLTLPLYQRKCTCLDALCHAIESYWSCKSDNESKQYAERAIKLFFKNKDGYINNVPQSNKGMLEASYYAGKAINITGTTAAHAMCYNITMDCSLAHGHSVAVCLSKIWEYMLECNDAVNDKRGRAYVLSVFDEIAHIMGASDATGGLKIFNGILDEFDLLFPSTDSEKIAVFVSKINTSRLTNNPTVITAEQAEEIYKRVLL